MPGGGTDQSIERIRAWTKLVSEKNLIRREFQRLIGGIAEEIFEEPAKRGPEVDASDAGEDATFPKNSHGNVGERLAAFAGGKMSGCPPAQAPVPARVIKKCVRIRHERRVRHVSGSGGDRRDRTFCLAKEREYSFQSRSRRERGRLRQLSSSRPSIR